MLRGFYAWLLHLHPPAFRTRFAEEMLWIFDQETGVLAAVVLIADGVRSLLRQWMLRPEFQVEAAPLSGEPALNGAPAFCTFDNGWFSRGALLQGLMLTVAIFCVFGLVLIYEHVSVPPARTFIVQKYGLAVLSPRFNPETYDAAKHAKENDNLLNVSIRDQSGPPSATPPARSFEVVSIKPNHSGAEEFVSMGFLSGRFTARNQSAKDFIEYAYSIRDTQLSGDPTWVSADKFDVDAEVEEPLAKELQQLSRDERQKQIKLMVQTMLAERFKLQVTQGTKELPIYELVVAKNGPKLSRSTATPAPPGIPGPRQPLGPGTMRMGIGRLTGTAVPLSAFIGALATQPELGGRVVLDKTGLSGNFDFDMQWTPENRAATLNPTDAQPDPNRPFMFTAIQEQLGLRLQSTKGPVQTIVIDHIDEPSPN